MKHRHVLVAGGLCVCVWGTALAQTAGNAGEFEFKLGLEGRYSNNFYYSNANTRATSGAVISPIVEYTRSSSAADIGITAKSDLAAFSYGDKDNYIDWFTSGTVNFKLPGRHVLGFTAIGQYGHDPFGTERTVGQNNLNQPLDEWSEYSGTVAFLGGQAESAKFGYEFKYTSSLRQYETNQVSTRFLDRQFDTATATLLYNFTAKFSALIEGIFQDLTYDNIRTGDTDRSGDALIGMVGVRWAASAKTSGDIRVGQGEWRPDDAGTVGTDTSFYEASVTWEPTRRSTLRLTGGRSYVPTYRFDAIYIDSQTAAFEWAQLWTYRSSTKFIVGYAERDFVGVPEQHDFFSVTGRYTYQIDRDVNVYIQSRYLDRDAVIISEQFDATTASIGLEAKFN